MRLFSFAVGLSVFTLDLLTKWFVKNTIWLHHYTVIKGFFTIQYVRNEGIAFGLFHQLDSAWKPLLLSAIAFVAIIVVTYYILTTPREEWLMLVALGLLLGGIMGNLADRLVHEYVVDFLTLHWYSYFVWPTFNLADAAITTGVFLVLFQTLVGDRSKILAAVISIPFFIVNVSGAPRLDDADQLIDRLQSNYEQIQSFSAHFEQTFSSRGIEVKESGLVMMKQPGKMYWEYQDPVEKFFVADGKKTYFYVPKDNQMLVTEFDLSRQDSPLLFLLGKGNLHRDFYASIESEKTSSEGADQFSMREEEGESPIVLRLTPRTPHPEFSYLILHIIPDTFLIRKLVIVEPIGQQNEYLLSDFRKNTKIPDRTFELDVPPHVEVIEQ